MEIRWASQFPFVRENSPINYFDLCRAFVSSPSLFPSPHARSIAHSYPLEKRARENRPSSFNQLFKQPRERERGEGRGERERKGGYVITWHASKGNLCARAGRSENSLQTGAKRARDFLEWGLPGLSFYEIVNELCECTRACHVRNIWVSKCLVIRRSLDRLKTLEFFSRKKLSTLMNSASNFKLDSRTYL